MPDEGKDPEAPIIRTSNLTMGDKGEAVKAEVLLLVATAESLKITGQGEYTAAAALLTQVTKLRGRANNARLDRTRPIDAAKATIMDLYRPITEALENGEGVLKKALAAYESERETERLLAQRKLQLAAEAEAEQERQRLLAEALTIEAGSDDDDEDEHYRAWRDAEDLRDAAENVVARTDIAQAVVPGYAPAPGLARRVYWQFRIDDPDMVPRQFLCPDERAIREYVSRMKEDAEIPGVTIWDESTVHSSGR